MEDNSTPQAPTPCTAGCGFYGSTIYNNMCSKCFKELDSSNKKDIKKESTSAFVTKEVITETILQPIENDKEETVELEKPITKIIQKNKGRCFSCKSKIPLAKQLTNKCKCEYVYCDTHRFPDKHECNFDHAKNDKDILAKNNPKLNEKPRGGNSFTRIDSS